MFNPFANIPSELYNHQFRNSNIKPTLSVENSGTKLKKIVQLSKDKILLVADNGLVTIIQRNTENNQFDFPSI